MSVGWLHFHASILQSLSFIIPNYTFNDWLEIYVGKQFEVVEYFGNKFPTTIIADPRAMHISA